MNNNSLLNMIKEDYKVNNLNFFELCIGLLTINKFYLILLYRFSHYLKNYKIPFLPRILRTIGLFFYACDINPEAKIGKGLKLHHAIGIVIGEDVVAGDYLQLFHHVTIGGRNKSNHGQTMPRIGNNVICFTGSVIIGPIYIGDNSSIAPNSVVIHDVPSNSIVSGIPAKIIKEVEII